MGSFSITFLMAVLGSLLVASPRPTLANAEAPPPAPPVLAVIQIAPVPVLEVEAPPMLSSMPPAESAEVWTAMAEDTSLPERWSPPDWFPDGAREELWALEGISGAPIYKDGPALRAASALIYDVDSGRVLWAHNADDMRPVASLTKVVASLTALSEVGPGELERELCIDPSSWPGWPGAHSYLNTGVCTTGWDLLGAALVASDNRAAFALQRVSGLPFGPFVGRMNEVAAELGMDMSSFADPAGVADDNLSTARDMTRAILAASLHPVLSNVASAPSWDIEISDRARPRRLFSTNRMVDRKNLEFLAGKTGYTDTSRYCFDGVVRTADGRRLAFAVLGAPNNRARWADVEKLLSWAATHPAG